jgi:hypothetical protein
MGDLLFSFYRNFLVLFFLRSLGDPMMPDLGLLVLGDLSHHYNGHWFSKLRFGNNTRTPGIDLKVLLAISLDFSQHGFLEVFPLTFGHTKTTGRYATAAHPVHSNPFSIAAEFGIVDVVIAIDGDAAQPSDDRALGARCNRIGTIGNARAVATSVEIESPVADFHLTAEA